VCFIILTLSDVCLSVCVCVVLLRLLFWTEKQLDGEGRLMQCRLDGSGPRTVLRRRRQRLRNSRSSISTQTSSRCTCPELSVALSFAVDYTQPESQLKIYVADSDSGDIWSVDEAGCHCQLIVNATTLSPTSSDIGQYTRTGLLLLCHKSYTVKTRLQRLHFCHRQLQKIWGSWPQTSTIQKEVIPYRQWCNYIHERFYV